jgi:hypothetical protein
MFAAAVVVWAGLAQGYLVRPPLSMEALIAEADLVFKGTVVSIGPEQDAWFQALPGFVVQETQFAVVSVIEGDNPGATLRFRHYDDSPQSRGHMYQPQFYHFEPNRTYIVFAKKADEAAGYRQLWANHTGKEDQGVLLCLDNKPVTAKTVKEAFWSELTGMLGDTDAGNVMYAIRQLDQMSGGQNEYDGTKDFDRTDVLEVVHGLVTDSNAGIAQAAITVIGSGNPYLSDERTDFWLATVGSAEVPGLSKMDPEMRNAGGEMYWEDLAAIADARHPADTRALAIRALGRVREPALREAINRWLVDGELDVRAAATVLLADFPGTDANQQLTVLADDPEPRVRECAARAIGYAQQQELVNVLGRLLADPDRAVRRVASVSLLSFSPKNEAIAAVFRANLANKEFEPLFLNALARETPEPYLDALARVVEEKTEPENWSGGEIPAFTAWKILFKYLQTQSTEVLNSGNVNHYLDAMEEVGNYSSSNPRDIYAFYILRGMTERAKSFRDRANAAASYDLDYYFKQVDQNPSHNSL